MGAIFFYIFIYFLGYYGSNILNMFTVRPLITNRFIAALIPVFCIALLHGYMIVTKPPPSSQDITVESALFTYVAMPVVIVTLGAIYFMWNARRSEEEEAEEAARRAAEDAEEDDDENLKDEQETSGASAAEKTTPDADEKRN
ncbi:MAG: hypothetical protein R3E36_10610 [Nitrosomonas sp.]|nr:hypothetical protein [Nitrosomonas sp.]MCP5251643.1 hypothetical protein [Burkholderiales bacterium]MDR4521031.1 hypothetical protein [Nitrosomonas sp.]